MTQDHQHKSTPLDASYAAWMEAPDSDIARMQFYGTLAAVELFMLLKDAPEGDQVSPELVESQGVSMVLVFDTEERLADFAGREAAHVTLSGRALAGMIAPEGLGLALNPEVAPSASVIEPDVLAWLVQVLDEAPDQREDRPEEIRPPAGLPESLLTALDARLAGSEGLALQAYLVEVAYQGGRRSHMLGFVGAVPGAEGALAQSVQEALTFSGVEAGSLDVAFIRGDDPIAATLAQQGLRFDLPQAEVLQPLGAPGSNPAKPPKLR